MNASFHRADTTSTVSEFQIGEDDIICDPNAGLPVANWSKQATVVNKIDVKYNFNNSALIPNDFGTHQIYTADESVERFAAQPAITSEFEGVHTSLGGQAIVDRFALLLLQRWGTPPPILLCSVPFRRHLFEQGDKVYVTHSKIPDPERGKLGLDSEAFEVITVSPQFLDPQGRPNGRLDLALLRIGTIEQSFVPVSSGALSLVQGTSTIDGTDVAIGLGSSASVTTPGAACRTIRIGLSAILYRVWVCAYDTYTFDGQSCVINSRAYNSHIFNSQITYHLEYKTSGAPNSPGSGGDPTTGWVTLLGSQTGANTALVVSNMCAETPIPSPLPAQYFWSLSFPNPAAAPSVYNVRVHWDSLQQSGGACPDGHPPCADLTGLCSDILVDNVLYADAAAFSIDFIQGIT